ncbi:MAG TPA: magnesium transporter CorA family protein, partial [Deinococcales bacterium]|nr:magnesium transporter CorA family protein [Deinococcales bacterium]
METVTRLDARPVGEVAHPGIRTRYLGGSGEAIQGLPRALSNVWVDVESPTEDDLAVLRQRLGFHPLALEDALEVGHWSRFEAYPEHLFLVFRTLAEPDAVNELTERISIFWYTTIGVVLTIRNEPVRYLEAVWRELDGRPGQRPQDVTYALLSRATSTFFDFLDALEDSTDQLEQLLFEPVGRRGAGLNNRQYATRVFELKNVMISARRVASSGREAVSQMSRHVAALLVEDAIRVRDLNDQLARVYDGLDSARDLLTSLLDVHLNVESNRLNE